MNNYSGDEFFMNALPMPAFPVVDAAYQPWHDELQQPGMALVVEDQLQPMQLIMAKPEPEYLELRPMQPVQQQLQPLPMQPLQQLQINEQLPLPLAIPVYFPANETDVYTPPPCADFIVDPYMLNIQHPVEMEPVNQETGGRKRKWAEVTDEEEADVGSRPPSADFFSDYPYMLNTNLPVAMEAKPVKKKKTRGRKSKQPEVIQEEEAEWDTSINTDQPDADGTETGEVFTNIVGRLCVIGSLIHYDVTTDEIRRRASMPEAFTHTHIGPLLKRGKVAGTGDELRKLLEKQAIALPDGQAVNRKQYALTTLSALLEAESVQLSADHRELLLAHLPLRSLALLMMRTMRSPAALAAAAGETAAARTAMSSFSSVLDEWTSGGWKGGRAAILASPLRTFAYATHALGVEECRLMAMIFSKFLQALEEEISALLERVNAAGCGSAVHLHQFPAGIDLPPIPEGLICLPDWTEEAAGSTSFAETSGRLTLNNKRYNVTVAEVYRRVRQPECFNLSILGSLLKKAKTANNCERLFDQLKEHKILLAAGRRKNARNRTFTALLEGEALALASDLEAEAGRSFPAKNLIAAILKGTSRDDVDERRYGFSAASGIAKSLRETVLSLRLPIADRIPHAVSEDAHVIFEYCQLTHGYGPDALISWMGIFGDLFEKTADKLGRE